MDRLASKQSEGVVDAVLTPLAESDPGDRSEVAVDRRIVDIECHRDFLWTRVSLE